MKIVNVIGGLGNQMFQYAFALGLQEKFPDEEILVDTSHFNYVFVNKLGAANLHNGYEIDKIFQNAHLRQANYKELTKVTRYIPNYSLSRIARKLLPVKQTEFIQPVSKYFEYDRSVYDILGNCYYEGIWESVNYHLPFRDKIKDVFTHPRPDLMNTKVISKIAKSDSVGIHIRRGDYLKSEAFKGICDLNYYQNAISAVLSDGKEHVFFIFSNDIVWCNENIKPLLGDNEAIMVDWNTGKNSFWDMFLMTYCKDLIIANSSFSWWGAFLNKRSGRIIAPDKWTNRDVVYDIWAADWIKI